MAIKTQQYNDASHLNLKNLRTISENIDLLIEDLKELKTSGGDITLPIKIGSVIHNFNYGDTKNFSNPFFLMIHLHNYLGAKNFEGTNFNIDSFHEKMRSIVELIYENVDDLFKYKFEDNTIILDNNLSQHEMGALFILYPEKAGKFLKQITDVSKDWYLNFDNNKNYRQRGLFKDTEDSYLKFTINEENNNLDYPFLTEKKSTKKLHVLSLAGFSFLSHLKFPTIDTNNTLYQNFKLIESWIQGQEKTINEIVATFNEEQKKFYEHFLHEKFSKNLSQTFTYLLNRENLSVPEYISLEDFTNKALNEGVPSKDISYLWSLENEEYVNYLNKFKVAILNKDYDFLSKNLPSLNLENYKNFTYNKPNIHEDFNFFMHTQDLDMVKFLEKFNIEPIFNYKNETVNLIATNKYDLFFKYIEYKPNVPYKDFIGAYFQSQLEHIKQDLISLNFQEEMNVEAIATILEDKFSDFLIAQKKFIVNNKDIPSNSSSKKFTFDFKYILNDKVKVKTILNIFNKYLEEEQIFHVMNVFLAQSESNNKLITGIKDFMKTQKYDISDTRFARTYFNTRFTDTTRKKILKDFTYNPNDLVKNEVVWWGIDRKDEHLTIGQGLVNAKNNNGMTFLDLFLSEFVKTDIGSSSRIKTLSMELNKVLHAISPEKPKNNILEISSNCTNKEGLPDIVYFINKAIERQYPLIDNSQLIDAYLNDIRNNRIVGSQEEEKRQLNSGIVLETGEKDFFGTFDNSIPRAHSIAFSKLIEHCNWQDMLPKLFEAIPSMEEKDRFFRNITLAFANDKLFNIFHPNLVKRWEALFKSHNNYDMIFNIYSNKLLNKDAKKISYDETLINNFKSITKFPDRKSNDYYKILDLSDFEINLMLQKEKDNLPYNIDYALAPRLGYNYNQLLVKQYNELSFVDIVDAVTFNRFTNEELSTSGVMYKEKKSEISAIFNKFIFAKELGAKLIDKPDTVIHQKRKI